MRSFRKTRDRLLTLLESMEQGVDSTENAVGRYILNSYELDDTMGVYFGFRYSSDWYFDKPLLSGEPEVVVYVKDVETDVKKAKRQNERLRTIFKGDLNSYHKLGKDNIEYIERDYQNHNFVEGVRLFVRKSLREFINKEDDEISKWLENVAGIIRNAYSKHSR